nr:unnamed protein product [Digitaria exilis]
MSSDPPSPGIRDSPTAEAVKIHLHVVKPPWAITVPTNHSNRVVCIGVIYGDIDTSPLYVYQGTFSSGISNVDDLYGVLSIILYSIILLPMIKYVFIVLYANDNGDDYFKRNGKDAWISLGGTLLCFTGTEAMFADLGHFNVRAVQLSFSFVLFPAVSLAYIGQAAFLRKHPEHVLDTFYKSIPERFLFRNVESKTSRMFRCVARYGYSDKLEGAKEFAASLIEGLQSYIEEGHFITDMQIQETEDQTTSIADSNTRYHKAGSTVYIEEALTGSETTGLTQPRISSYSAHSSARISEEQSRTIAEEKQFIQRELQKGVVYILGETEIKAGPESSFVKKVVVNYMYSFLRKNFRQGEKAFAIPRQQVLKVGMVYEI